MAIDTGIANPAATPVQGSNVSSLLGQFLNVNPAQFATSSGQGPYGNWSGTITPAQYQQLLAAGFDPNAATIGRMGMQSFGSGGGLSVKPIYGSAGTDDWIVNPGAATGYDVNVQSNLAGANLAADQAAASTDWGETFAKLAIGGMFGAGLAGLAGYGPLAATAGAEGGALGAGTAAGTVAGGAPVTAAQMLAQQGAADLAMGFSGADVASGLAGLGSASQIAPILGAAGLGTLEAGNLAALTEAGLLDTTAGTQFGNLAATAGATPYSVPAITSLASPISAASTASLLSGIGGGGGLLSSLGNLGVGDALKGASLLNSLLGGGTGTTAGAGTAGYGLGGLASGLGTLLSKGGVTPNQATVNAADPMAQYRGGLASAYNQYLQPGATVDPSQMPGYSQFMTGVVNPAMQATTRAMAAQGRGQSGAEQIALQKVGQQGYSNFMTDYLNRLASASGATQSPATAVQLGLGASAQQLANQQSGLGSIFGGAGNLLNSGILGQIFGTGGTGIAPGSYNLDGTGATMPGLQDTQSVLQGYDPNTYVPPNINVDIPQYTSDLSADWTSFI